MLKKSATADPVEPLTRLLNQEDLPTKRQNYGTQTLLSTRFTLSYDGESIKLTLKQAVISWRLLTRVTINITAVSTEELRKG